MIGPRHAPPPRSCSPPSTPCRRPPTARACPARRPDRARSRVPAGPAAAPGAAARSPLAVLLVALDALSALAFPDHRPLRRRRRDHAAQRVRRRWWSPSCWVSGSSRRAGWSSPLETVATARAGESVLYLLRVRSYAHLQRLGLDYYERELSGRIMTRMTTDVDALSTFLQTGLAQAIVSLLTVVGVAVALLVTDVGARAGRARRAAAADRGDGGVPAAVVAGLRRRPREGQHRQRRPAGERRRRAGRAGVRPRGAQRHRVRRPQRRLPALPAAGPALHRDLLPVRRAAVATSRRPRCSASAPPGWPPATITAGVLTAFLLYLGMFFTPVQQLSQVFDGYQQASVGLSRIGELLRTPTSVPPEPAGDAGRRCRPGCAGEVELADVSASATRARTEPALDGRVAARRARGDGGAGRRDRRRQVHAGQAARPVLRRRRRARCSSTASTCGGSGSPTTGTGWVWCRRSRTCSPATSRANIAYGRPDATPRRDRGGGPRGRRAGDLVRGLPGGLPHPVGERGQGLSAGQRQLIALARAELVDPDLLLFDEATAALDPATEAAVLAAGRPGGTARRTAFVVAHRLTTAARADRVVVLDGGPDRRARHATPSCSRGRAVHAACGGRASWSPPRTRPTVTPMISIE